MPWLFRTSIQFNDPAHPEKYDYNITMATQIDDGFGADIISMKNFDMTQAAEMGFELPKLLEQLNTQFIAGNDALKKQLVLVEQAYEEANAKFEALQLEYDKKKNYFIEALADKDQKIDELKASMNEE